MSELHCRCTHSTALKAHSIRNQNPRLPYVQHMLRWRSQEVLLQGWYQHGMIKECVSYINPNHKIQLCIIAHSKMSIHTTIATVPHMLVNLTPCTKVTVLIWIVCNMALTCLIYQLSMQCHGMHKQRSRQRSLGIQQSQLFLKPSMLSNQSFKLPKSSLHTYYSCCL